MKKENLYKLLRNPSQTLRDGVSHRIRQFLKLSSGARLGKYNEHLLAVSLLGCDAPPLGSPSDRVYVLTDVPFWRAELGNQCRILALLRYLDDKFAVTVIFTGTLTLFDAKQLGASPWAKSLRTLVNLENALRLERAYRSEPFKDRQLYVSRELFRDFYEKFPCRAVIVEYITHEPIVRGLDIRAIKIIDTHDIMSQRMKVFAENGRDHHIKIREEEELHWLGQFDKVLAIQSDDANWLRSSLGHEKVILAPHALPPTSCFKDRPPKRLVYLAGASPANVDSINWFLDQVWPLLDEWSVELHIFGGICSRLSPRLSRRKNEVYVHGKIEVQAEVYQKGDIVLNPVLYGGGLKIKTVEAMAHGLPMVTSPEGARGLEFLAGKAFLVADSATAFAQALIDLLEDGDLRLLLSSASLEYVACHFSGEACFSELGASISSHRLSETSETGVDECLDSLERVMILGRRDFPFFVGAEQALSKFKNAFFVEPDLTESEFEKLVRKECVDRVLINNPYINERVRRLYLLCKSMRVPVTTFDRGALPKSWFFDPNGFNGDSNSYLPEFWDRPLSRLEAEGVGNYISKLFASGEALEKQGPEIGAAMLRDQLGVGSRKVLFIPFQRPGDTVVKFFGGSVDGMPGFLEFIASLRERLPENEWIILGKRHPLEVSDFATDITLVGPETNINDLVRMADACFMINSGVGVLSLMAGTPTFVCGQAFYNHEGLAVHVANAEQLIGRLRGLTGPDKTKVHRFVRYLVDDFYSFGDATGYLRKEGAGELSPITTGIRFQQLRGIGPRDMSGAVSGFKAHDSIASETISIAV